VEKGEVLLTVRMTPRPPASPFDRLNGGTLAVTVHSAQHLVAADRSGLSDPYCIVTLDAGNANVTPVTENGYSDDDDVTRYTTQTCRKTLAPQWDEVFTFEIESVESQRLRFDVRDWDRIGSHAPLGDVSVDLMSLGQQVRSATPCD
jgi:Ca2+-dependent lipid-binding protein